MAKDDDIKQLDLGFDTVATSQEPEEPAIGETDVEIPATAPPPPPQPAGRGKGGCLLPFLGFLILALGIGYVYYDFQLKLLAVTSAGSAQVAAQVNEEIAKMSQQIADQKAELDRAVASMRAELGKTDTTVTSIKRSQAQASALEKSVSGVKRSLSGLKKELAVLGKKADDLGTQMKKLSGSVANLEEDLLNTRMTLEQELEFVKTRTVDRNSLNATLKQERAAQQESLKKMSDVLLGSIRSLEKDIAELNRKTATPAP